MNLEDEGLSELDAHTSPIVDAKYGTVDIEEIYCLHLNNTQYNQLKEILLKHDKLIDGVLKEYPGQPMHIDLQPDASPVYKKSYPVPEVYLATFKKIRSFSRDWSTIPSQRCRMGTANFHNTQKKMAQ